MGCADVVITRAYRTRAPDIPAYDDIMFRYINGTRPSANVGLVPSFASSVFVVAVELTIAKHD